MCSQDSTDVYQKHNYVNSLYSYFNIRDEDRLICLKLYEEDILNKTVLGIFIKCFDIETADKFFLFRDELFERHEYDVLYKIFMALRGSYD